MGDQKDGRREAELWQGYAGRKAFLREVRRAAAEWFREQEAVVNGRYPYILAQWEAWPRNIIVDEVAYYIRKLHGPQESGGRRLALHKYIHHGLSSQALLFNLIGPLIVMGEFDLLADALGVGDGQGAAADLAPVLEYEDRAIFGESRGVPTSIDLAMVSSGRPVFFLECKFTEAEFGGCSVAAAGGCDGRNPATDFGLCYLHTLGRQYWTAMAKHGFVDEALRRERLCVMARHYQFFREVLFALEYGRPLVLLTDARNPSFGGQASAGRGLIPLLLSYVPEAHLNQIVAVTIQEVVERIRRSGRHDDWVGTFESKYGL